MKDTSVKDVFISYRRVDGFPMALNLYYRLIADGYTVFLDVKESQSDRFDKELYKRIEECTDFILIVSARCFEGCENPKAWVRQEVEHALQCGKHIVPLILPDCKIPEDLPDSMQEIGGCTGIQAEARLIEAVYEELERELMHAKPRVSIADLGVAELDSPAWHLRDKGAPLHQQMCRQALQDTMNRADNHITAIRAAQGDAEAQFRLWEFYHTRNESTHASAEEMIYWLKLAVAQNHPKAMCCLGKCYYYGYGVKRHPAKAVIFYRKSLEYDENLTESMWSLGDCYLNGVGVKSDVLQAANLYKKAMEAGDSAATAKYIDLIQTVDAAKELNIVRVVKKIQSMIEKKEKSINYPKVGRLLAIRMMGALKYGILFNLRAYTVSVAAEHTMDQVGETYLQKYRNSFERINNFVQAVFAIGILFGIAILADSASKQYGVLELWKFEIPEYSPSENIWLFIFQILIQIFGFLLSIAIPLLWLIGIGALLIGILIAVEKIRENGNRYSKINHKMAELVSKCAIVLLIWYFIDPSVAIVIFILLLLFPRQIVTDYE